MNNVPRARIRDCNQAPVRADRSYVLYWMIAARRPSWNFALDRAIELACQLDRPLAVLEALRCDYRWANDRIHSFIIDGMRDNRSAFKHSNVFYYAYVEPEQGAGKGLLETLAQDACAIVTDEFPCFFLPRMVAAAAQRLKVKLEAVDGNGLLPLRAADRDFQRAYDFLDQLVTWRELGYNFCAMRDDYDKYSSLPDWSKQTLKEHRKDERPFLYALDQFEHARTHDELWNAAQNQLRRGGQIHNYLRMLWGKKIIHWSKSPQQALEIMIEMNNKYGIDGRNPNSYSGIFWTLGRYDRPWGPEREIFGKIRYMSSDNTRRKLDVREYLKRWTNEE